MRRERTETLNISINLHTFSWHPSMIALDSATCEGSEYKCIDIDILELANSIKPKLREQPIGQEETGDFTSINPQKP